MKYFGDISHIYSKSLYTTLIFPNIKVKLSRLFYVNTKFSIKYGLFLLFATTFISAKSQSIYHDSLAITSEPINYSKRQDLVKWVGLSTYVGGSFALYNFWYKDFDQEAFHFFNDFGEWSNVDKFGHIYASYLQSDLLYHTFKWSGHSDDKSILLSSLASFTYQTTIEVMDGFFLGMGVFYT